MFIIRHKNIFFILSVALVIFSLFSVFFWGLNPGIEFTGGSITEVRFEGEPPPIDDVRSAVSQVVEGDILVQPTGGVNYIIRTQELDEDGRSILFEALSFDGTQTVHEERYSLVGPSIGHELRGKAWIAISFVLFLILLFIAFAFRKVSEGSVQSITQGASSWHYSLAAIIALAHDIIIPTGIFAFLGSRFIDAQIDVLFVTALLAILGYSINDTIVVFDRVRENLRRNQETKSKASFSETVGKSLEETYARSINTSLTTLFVLLSLFFIGGAAIKNFALVLAIGVVSGTYSSIFLATPLLVAIAKIRRK